MEYGKLKQQEIDEYWTVQRNPGSNHANGPGMEGFTEALVRMMEGDENSLVVFRQLMETAETPDERAQLAEGYLRNLPWRDNPDFAGWLRSVETSSSEDTENFALIRKYSENAELPSKPADTSTGTGIKKKGERWPKTK